MSAIHLPAARTKAPAWNNGRMIGQKRALQPKHIWVIRPRLKIADSVRDLALNAPDRQFEVHAPEKFRVMRQQEIRHHLGPKTVL